LAKNHGSSVKDDKTYEALREDGASKEKAARIANAKAGGATAADVGIEGRSKMDKGELIDALRNH
jgi:hypothetical protein